MSLNTEREETSLVPILRLNLSQITYLLDNIHELDTLINNKNWKYLGLKVGT